jgi:hypothetical protein
MINEKRHRLHEVIRLSIINVLDNDDFIDQGGFPAGARLQVA